MADEIYPRGLDLQVGDVILRRDGRAGAVLMEQRAHSRYGEPTFVTDSGVEAQYRCNQVYRVLRPSEEEMREALEGE